MRLVQEQRARTTQLQIRDALLVFLGGGGVFLCFTAPWSLGVLGFSQVTIDAIAGMIQSYPFVLNYLLQVYNLANLLAMPDRWRYFARWAIPLLLGQLLSPANLLSAYGIAADSLGNVIHSVATDALPGIAASVLGRTLQNPLAPADPSVWLSLGCFLGSQIAAQGILVQLSQHYHWTDEEQLVEYAGQIEETQNSYEQILTLKRQGLSNADVLYRIATRRSGRGCRKPSGATGLVEVFRATLALTLFTQTPWIRGMLYSLIGSVNTEYFQFFSAESFAAFQARFPWTPSAPRT